MKAFWKDVVLAESDEGIEVEGNYYFPPNSIQRQYFRESDTHTVCAWKGTASYYDLIVGEDVNADAAWFYPAPKPAAQEIEGYVAFYRNRVQIVDSN